MEKIDNPSVKVMIPWDKPRGIDSCRLALCQWYLTFALA